MQHEIEEVKSPEQHGEGFQPLSEYELAVSKAWGELDLDPMLNGNPAMSPSGQTCCACY
jgi:hypothetical protein